MTLIKGKTNLINSFVNNGFSDNYVKTGLNWFVVDCDLDHSTFAFRIADIGGHNSDEIEACASLGLIHIITHHNSNKIICLLNHKKLM